MSTVSIKQHEIPALSDERLAELEALAQMPESAIDYSDAPALNELAWAHAARSALHRPVKTHATVRIDADIMAWLKSQGKGYQTRLNAILRRAMLEAMTKGQTGDQA